MRLPLLAVAVLSGCGDNLGPRALIADPAVETGCRPGPVAAGRARAKRVDCVEELVPGRLAAGRIGDLVLENAQLRVIVRGLGEGYYLHGTAGGGIVDAAAVGGEDLVLELVPSVELGIGAFDELVIVEAGDDGDAEIVARGRAGSLDLVAAALDREPPPVIVEHAYKLAPDATAIELVTRVYVDPGSDETTFTLYDAMFFGGRAATFVPGRGFVTGQSSAEIVAVAGTTSSYGLVYGPDDPDPQLVDLAGIRLVQGPAIDRVGARRWLIIGDGSVASVVAAAWQLRGAALGTVSGTTAPGVDIVVRDALERPLAVARAAPDGAFRVAVPPGSVTLQAESPEREPGPRVAVDVVAGAEQQAAVPAGPGGHLALSVRDDAAQPLPARVILERDADRRVRFVDASGELSVGLPPGAWRVSVSRGLEYEAFVAAGLAIVDGQVTRQAVTLAHVVDTTGWISLDTHLHAELSTDSTFPLDDRLRAVAAEGVELPVSADHDFITDYAPVIAELGLEGWVGSLVGEEASSLVWGHVNAFPLAVDPSRAGGGAVRWRDRSPGEVFAELRGSGGARIVQVNHPRFGNASLFDALDLDPSTLTARRDPAELGLPPSTDLGDLSFDAVEVANALADDDFEAVFADYLRLVAAGHPAAATGASDSHGPTAFAGEARTYVHVGAGADTVTIDPAAVVAGIKARRVVVATGAFVTAGIVAGSTVSLPGDTVTVPAATPISIRIRVQAPSWQALAGVRIYERTQQIRAIALDPSDAAPVRYDADVVLPAPAADTFFVVRVDPVGPGDPVIERALPSFTNPLFVRVGG